MKTLPLILPLLCLLTTAAPGQTDSLTLEAAIQEALSNNPDIRTAERDIDIARARVLRAGALPGTEFTVSIDDIPSTLNLLDAEKKGVSITQPFEFPGKAGRRIDAARVDERIAIRRLTQMRTLVTARVMRLHARTVLSGAIVATRENIDELLQRFEELARVRYEARLSPFLEVLRTRVEIAKNRNALIEARQTQRSDLSALAECLGRTDRMGLRVPSQQTFEPVSMDRETCIASELESRSSLAIARMRIERMQTGLAIARSAFQPDFSVGLGWQHLLGQAPYDANGFTGTSAHTFSLSLGVTLPLLSRQGPQGEVDAATQELAQAEHQFATLQRSVALQIADAWDQMKAAEEQVRTFQASLLTDLDDELRAGLTLYRNNQIDALNLIEIYRTYTESRAEYFRALHNHAIAVANLRTAGEEHLHPDSEQAAP